MINFELQIIITIITLILLETFERYIPNRLSKVTFFAIVAIASFSNLLFLTRKYNYILSLLIFLSSFYHFLNNYKYISPQKSISDYTKVISFNNSSKLPFLVSFCILMAVILSEYFLFDGSLSAPSFMVILFAILFMFSGFDKKDYEKEFDYIFTFTFFLCMLYVVPHVYLKVQTGTLGEAPVSPHEAFLVETFLGNPLAKILDIFGFHVWSDGERIFFVDSTTNLSTSVFITTGCSGLHTILIFLCFLLTYLVMERNERTTLDSVFLLFLGITISYLANLFRMSTIIVIGHYYGNDALKFAHANIGWIIFTFWFYLFYEFLNRYSNRRMLL